jgi:insertion element IS1 protein InsB
MVRWGMIREIITHQCRACASINIVKNGKNRHRKQQFKCKDCGKQAVLNPSEKYSEAQKEQILATYQERPSKGGMQRIYGLSRNTLSWWLKKSEVL